LEFHIPAVIALLGGRAMIAPCQFVLLGATYLVVHALSLEFVIALVATLAKFVTLRSARRLPACTDNWIWTIASATVSRVGQVPTAHDPFARLNVLSMEFACRPENASAVMDGKVFNVRSQSAQSDAISVVFALLQDSADA